MVSGVDMEVEATERIGMYQLRYSKCLLSAIPWWTGSIGDPQRQHGPFHSIILNGEKSTLHEEVIALERQTGYLRQLEGLEKQLNRSKQGSENRTN